MNEYNGQKTHGEIPRPTTPPQKEPKTSLFLTELFKFALVALVIVIPVRVFIAQPFIVSGSSMDPTFENGEYLIVDEISYRFEEPERGDVVIFRFPRDPSKFFIKRIIGLPGERVQIRHGTITVFNDLYESGINLEEPYTSSITAGNRTVELTDSEYYVLGDNRASSSDSRIWGPLDRDLIIGKAFLRLLPVTRVGVSPGDFDF